MLTCTFEDGGTGTLRHVCVDAIVLKQRQVLMVKRTAKLLEGGKWGLIGGYLERNETLRQCVEREVMEETGYLIKDTTLLTFRDNPNRPNEDRQNISFVFFCSALEKTGKPDWESDDQRWYDLEALPPKEQIAFDHSANLELYKRYLENQTPLPIIQ